jgi:hypothetical protein
VRRKTVLLAAILVVATTAITSAVWYAAPLGDIAKPRHVLQISWGGAVLGVPERMTVVLLQNNHTIHTCVVSWGHESENVTVTEGKYELRLYNADNGVFYRKVEIFVAKDTKFYAGAP